MSDGSVNLRNLAYSMDQFLATPVADKGPVSFVMRQIASKAYQNELQLLRWVGPQGVTRNCSCGHGSPTVCCA